MMDCANVELRDLLPDHAHGRLSSAERAAVERHVAECRECAAELSLLRVAWRAFGATPAVDVSRIVAALPPPPMRRDEPGVTPIESRRQAPARRVVGRSWTGRAAAIAAVAVVAIALSLGRSGQVATGAFGDSITAVAGESSSSPAVAGTLDRNSTPARGDPEVLELSMAGGVADLSDDQLRFLLGEIESIDEASAFETDELLPALGGIEEDTTS